MIRKEAWHFYKKNPVSAYVGSSKNLKDPTDLHTYILRREYTDNAPSRQRWAGR